MVLARLAALPGADLQGALGGELLRAAGSALNRSVSLEWVPPEDRWAILYILLLPTAALLIALARLTFGLRVLGFRSILIAVGFQEIGVAPSLLLMLIVIAIILAMRPSMQRMQLTFYARTSVILCIAAAIMVAGLLLGPWLRSELLWSFAFFPVIILAMLAEGVAVTLARDDAWTAAWRVASTLLLALVIAFVSWIPAVREAALRFPELMLTQLVAVVFVSEFLDFRMFEDLPARLAYRLRGVLSHRPGPTRVAVVRNRSSQAIVDALRAQGFRVRVFEGDPSLLHGLHGFLPQDPVTGAPGGIVLNLAASQDEGRSGRVPAMLEKAGMAYTGPDPIVQARLLDRAALLPLLREAGVPAQPLARGREIRAALLGNDPIECLPLLEVAGERRICPADLDAVLAERVRECARDAYIAAGCRDYARIDMRLTAAGEPQVTGVHAQDLFARRGSFAQSAQAAGLSFDELMRRVVEVAWLRCGVEYHPHLASNAA